MINVLKTLHSTIKEKVDNLRFLADNNPQVFKKILYLIIANDLAEWAAYRDEPQETQKALKELQLKIILGNYEFIIEREDGGKAYINVNTPLTNTTWDRVWDDFDVVTVTDTFLPIKEKPTFTPDPNCEISMVYFPTEAYGGVGIDANGSPLVDIDNLTTCEKMNIFINRESGKMYYLNDECNWEPLASELVGKITVDLVEGLKVYKGIRHALVPGTEATNVEVELLEDGSTIDRGIAVTNGEKDLEDVL